MPKRKDYISVTNQAKHSADEDEEHQRARTQEDYQHHSQAAGCVVTKEDTPAVITSLICFVFFIAYGTAAASLGPAVPYLAEHYGKSISEMGTTFTVRGIGYFLGTLSSPFVLAIPRMPFAKETIASVATFLFGIELFLVDLTSHFGLALCLFFLQGFSFGIIDVIGNCVLPELWGKRLQPWMQALHSMFGVGAIIGPSLIGGFGYSLDFFLIFLLSFIPITMVLARNMLGYGTAADSSSNDDNSSLTPASSSKSKASDTVNEEVEEEARRAAAAADRENTAKRSTAPQRPGPLLLRVIVFFFFFIYVGAETGFAGWIPSYVLMEEVTTSPSKAAYLSALFWAALTLGRILAVPTAIFVSATMIIQIQLLFGIVTGILCITLLTYSYSMASFISFLAGFSLSSMFPVMMTIFSEYGYQIDASTTTLFMMGATFGESITPMCIGWLMSGMTPFMMPFVVFVSVWLLVVCYLAFHYCSVQERKDYARRTQEGLDDTDEDSSRHPSLQHHRKAIYNPVISSEAFTIDDDEEEQERQDQGDEEQGELDEARGDLNNTDNRGIEMRRFEVVDN